jgi:prepilin-type N-terminal cleavage/methylation domain-containing protein
VRQGFTLVEIMVILALIGLLAILAVPSFMKNRKQSQGKRIVNDARIIDAAINQWALETGQTDGNSVDLTAAAPYTKRGAISADDLLGNPYDLSAGIGPSQILISATTKSSLGGVGVDWGPY